MVCIDYHLGKVDTKLAWDVREIIQRPVGEFPLPFALVPWGQHIEIITRSESVEEAFFYIHQVIDKGLSRTALINSFKANLDEHQGKITLAYNYLFFPIQNLVE